MANITLSGILLDPTSEFAVGDEVRFTHNSTTGETIKSAISTLTIPPDGSYSIDLQYGLVLVEYKDIRSSQFKNLGVATVNGTNTATSIPELLNALVPVSSAELIEFQAILADAVTAQDAAAASAVAAASSATDSASSAASVDWLSIRYSKLENPLTHILKKNKLVDTLVGALTWNRATTATYVDICGVLKTAAIDEPRQEKEGWLIEGVSTNSVLWSNDFTQWQDVNCTISQDSTLAPDGSLAFKYTNNVSGASTSQLRQLVTSMPIGTTKTASIWVKGTQGETLKIEARATDSSSVTQRQHTLSGVWERLTSPLNSNWSAQSAEGVYISVRCDPTNTANNFYISFAQLEPLPFASSYIPTTSSAVTRAADNVAIQGADNIPLLSGSNSISMTVSTLGFDSEPQSMIVALADDNYNRNISFWAGSNTTILNYVSGSSKAFQVPVSRENKNSILSTYDSTTAVSYVNGVQKRTDTLAYTDTADSVSTIYIGQNSNNSLELNGYISDIRIYDFALNAAEASFLAGE